jgi:NADH-quinone oxidoreductase subunit N
MLPFLVAGAVSGALGLVLRSRAGLSSATAILGLAVMAGTAALIGPGSSIEVGGSRLAWTDWLRLYAVLGSVVGMLLVVVGAATLRVPNAGGVIVLGLSASVLAVAAADPGTAVVIATAGGLTGVLVAAPLGVPARAASLAAGELRALAVAGALAIAATAWLARPLDGLAGAPALFGLGYLAFAVAVAIRFGAMPFHQWAARVADVGSGVALPLVMAWAPAAFAAIALGWIDRSVAPVALQLPAERALVAAFGVVSVVLGLVAAWVQDDLEHVVGYTIVADAGFVVLALAVLDPAIWEPARTWLLVFVVTRTAFAAWAVATEGSFRTRQVPALAGWARQAPVLAGALVVLGIAAIGWPGLPGWDARVAIAGLALPEPLATLIAAAPLAGIAVYGRILLIGVGRPSTLIRESRGDRVGWPAVAPRRPIVGRGPAERTVERLERLGGGSLDVLWTVPAGLRWNRAPIASVVVLALAGIAAVAAAGGFGIPAAARAVPEAAAVGAPGGAGPASPAP